MKFSFFIVDDRELDCFIAEKIISKTDKSNSVKSYLSALEILKDLNSGLIPAEGHGIILLDIMMPVMNGFQFLEEFEQLPAALQKQFKVICITTSLDKSEIDKITRNDAVIGVLKKPYTLGELNEILKDISFVE